MTTEVNTMSEAKGNEKAEAIMESTLRDSGVKKMLDTVSDILASQLQIITNPNSKFPAHPS